MPTPKPAKKDSAKTERITATMFFKYDSCPHWLWFDGHGDPAKMEKQSSFTKMLLERGLKHEQDLIAGYEYVEVKRSGGNAVRFKETVRLMREGVERIYHGVLMSDEFVGEPDILEKRTDRSSDFGAYYYVAIDIKSAERLSDAHKYQLVCYGELLKAVQGVRPDEGYVLNASKTLISFSLREFEQQFHVALAEIRDVLAGHRPPPHLSSSCKQSPWFKECVALAKKTGDIALLYNVKKKAVLALREAGIHTIEDAAEIDPAELAGAAPTLKKALLERVRLQARSLIEDRHFVRKPIELPTAPLELHFDIEGDPLEGIEYLFGFLRVSGGEKKYEYMIAERPQDERKMWEEFLEYVDALPSEYVVYHYGTYEMTRLSSLEAKYGASKSLELFRQRLVDLNEIVKECIVFPLYFYGIKNIGGYIGFAREGKIAGGGESVAYYEEWLKTGNRKRLDDILLYNKEDVIATARLRDWLDHERSLPHEEIE
jgi:predicted RecB family nuclease